MTVPHGSWDLSSPAREGTHALCVGSAESEPLDRGPAVHHHHSHVGGTTSVSIKFGKEVLGHKGDGPAWKEKKTLAWSDYGTDESSIKRCRKISIPSLIGLFSFFNHVN